MKGFSLTELLLVIGLLLFLFSFAAPVGMNFYRNRVSQELSIKILSNLRQAQNQAFYQQNDSAYGVKFHSDSYVLFKGTSYSEGDPYNQVFDLPDNAEVTGIDEIVFSQMNGTSSAETLQIERFGETDEIVINKEGKIELQ